jgi:arylsulfatase A-like enzyme
MESLTDLAPNWSTEGPFVEAGRGVEWISQHRDESFFLFLHISPTHAPYRFPRSWYERVIGDAALRPRIDALRRHAALGGFLPVPEGDRIPEREIARFSQSARYAQEGRVEDELIALIRELYRWEVRVADEAVGMIVAELERLGIFGETVVSVSSDHGEELWDRGSFGHGVDAMHNEVIRTPWILTCPGRIGAGTVVAEDVSQTNVLPTVLDTAGVDIGGVPSSGSVKRLAARDAAAGEELAYEARPVFSDTSRWISVVRAPFKLIAPSRRTRFPTRGERLRHVCRRAKLRWTGRAGAGGLLYDLGRDPGERDNIARRERARTRDLLSAADRYYRTAQAEWPGTGDLTAAEEEQVKRELDRLGYL